MCRRRNNLQNARRACYFLKAAIISKVPVARYLGFNQSCHQLQGLGANHRKSRTTVLLWRLIIHISTFRKKHARGGTLLRAASEQDSVSTGRFFPWVFMRRVRCSWGQRPSCRSPASILWRGVRFLRRANESLARQRGLSPCFFGT